MNTKILEEANKKSKIKRRTSERLKTEKIKKQFLQIVKSNNLIFLLKVKSDFLQNVKNIFYKNQF